MALSKNESRLRRRRRVRKKLSGTAQRPRLSVFRSLNHIYVQVVDDDRGLTLVSASSKEKGFETDGDKKAKAKSVGEAVARRCLDQGIKTVVFDRGGYVYHGRVAAVAEGAREGGLEF